MEFEKSSTTARKRQYNLPDDFTGNMTRDELILSDGHRDPTAAMANSSEAWRFSCAPANLTAPSQTSTCSIGSC